MRRALSNCRLYSWMRLTWQSKIVSGSTVRPEVVLEPVGELGLGFALGVAESGAEAAIVGERLEPGELD